MDTRNRENRRHQHRENRSAYLATIGALHTEMVYPSVDGHPSKY